MLNILLLSFAAATFVFGWFLMKRLDMILEGNRQARDSHFDSGKGALRIGFSNPFIADSIADVLEQYSKKCSGIPVCLFHGSEESLISAFSSKKLNVIFLPENAEIPANVHYNIRVVSLIYASVMTKYGGLQIEPVTDGRITQRVLWSEEAGASFVRCFIACLEHKSTASY